MKKQYSPSLLLLEVVMIVITLLFFAPLYLVIVNAFKKYKDVLFSTAALPHPIQWSNFAKVWHQIQFPSVFLNTLVITVVSLVGILLISSMAAYQLVRVPGKVSNIIFYAILFALVIPFQTMMIPLVKVAKDLHLINNIPGVIVLYFGFGTPLALFLYHGFIKSVPIELEQAAAIDGCGTFRTFFTIILPLLKPITTTIAIIHSLWIWNDFLLPLLILGGSKHQTITLAYYIYFGQYVNQWELALAALVLSTIPIVIFYLLAQRYIIEGITAGAVKG